MKWHIYNSNHEPLCWDGKALEFDTDIDAKDFLTSAIIHSEYDADFYNEAVIEKDILHYDGEILNATNFLVRWDEENGETILLNKD